MAGKILLIILFMIIQNQLLFCNPKITNNEVVFDNNEKIYYQKKHIYFDNPEEANRKDLPTYYEEEIKDIPEWKKIIKIRNSFFMFSQELWAEQWISIFNYNGEDLYPLIMMEESNIYFIKKQKKIFITKEGYHLENSEHFLFDVDDGIITKIPLTTRVFGSNFTEDELYICFYSDDYRYRKEVPVMVYDLTGKLQLEQIVSKNAKAINFKIDEREYSVTMSEKVH